MAQASGMAEGLGMIVDQVAQEKGIDRRVLIETMEAAILKAAQAAFGPNRELEARYNQDTGNIDLFQYMTVVDQVAQPEREIALDVAQRHGLDAKRGRGRTDFRQVGFARGPHRTSHLRRSTARQGTRQSGRRHPEPSAH